MNIEEKFHSTTILCVRKNNHICMGGDGQISQGDYIFKQNVRKVMKFKSSNILVGFSGVTVSALKLINFLSAALTHYSKLENACMAMVKEWQKSMKGKIDAMILMADAQNTFLLSGSGDLFHIEEQVASIGSGGQMAKACAQGLINHSKLSCEKIVEESLKITSQICLYTNSNLIIENIT